MNKINNLLTADFKNAFTEYNAQLQAINIGTKAPEIVFGETEIQDLWNKFASKNNFTKCFQHLIQMVSKNGNYAIGLNWLESNNLPQIQLGSTIDFEYFGFELIKLTVNLQENVQNNLLQVLFQEWDLKNKSAYIPIQSVEKSMIYDQFLRSKKSVVVLNGTPNRYDFIPFIVWWNKWDQKPDIDQYLDFLFQSLNNDYELLMRDGLISRSLIFQNEKIIRTDLNKIILDPKQVLIKASKLQSFLSDPEAGMAIKQGNPQSLILLQKIDKQIALIEKLGNLKIDTSQIGTKNMHTTEVENISSNFDALLESKANFYEAQLMDFVQLWIKFCKNHNLINNTVDLTENIDITVYGSSKWWAKNELAKNVED